MNRLTPAEQRELEALLKQTEQNNQAFKRRLVQLLEKQKNKPQQKQGKEPNASY